MIENTFIGNNHKIEINDPATKNLFYEREINFLRQNIELKDKEIEARDRDIKLLENLMEEVKESRVLIKKLYERKIEDLKRTIEILQGQKLS